MLLKYAFKSSKVMGRFGVAGVLALAGIGLLFSSVDRWRYESALRDAVSAANTGLGDPRAALDEAVRMRPDDPFPTMLRGQWLLERAQLTLANADATGRGDLSKLVTPQLTQSMKDYDSAIAKTKDWPGSSDSDQAIAAAGAAAARLTLASADPAQSAALLDQAGKCLEAAPSSDEPDLLGVRAAYALLKGDTVQAQKLLAELSSRLGQTSRLGAAAYYWNHGVLLTLARDAGCAGELERAMLFRRTAEGGRVFGLAARLCASEIPAKSSEVLSARLAELRRMISYRARPTRPGATVALSRLGTESLEDGRIWNAIGIGHTRVPEADKALEALQFAANLNGKEFSYKLNRAIAYKIKAEHPAADEKDLKGFVHENMDRYASGLEQAASALPANGDKDKEGQNLLLTASVVRWANFEPPEATIPPLEMAKDKFHLPDAELCRWAGALRDWWHQLGYATPLYKRAIELHHKDSSKMEARIEKEQGKR